MPLLTTESIILVLVLVGGAIFLAVRLIFEHSYTYWKKKGVPFLKPKFPKGNANYFIPRDATYAGEAKYWFDEFRKRGYKFGGVWSGNRPVLVLTDPEYIKDIITKDFHHFIDRDFAVNHRDLLTVHLFNIRNPEWKSLRQKLTPTLTSGKMKIMFDGVLKCSNYMIDSLQKDAQIGSDINIREVLAAFTTDVIGNVAFGVDCNSFDESQNEFRKNGRLLFRTSFTKSLKRFILSYFPNFFHLLQLKLTPAALDFFVNVVKQAMEFRSKNNVHRNDFLQLLIDMNQEKKDGEKPFSFEQIVANTILFFIAGFDTSSTAMNFTLYELSRNPEIQEKARQEINKVLLKYDGQVTYESLQEMSYLQQCIDEAMRKFPSLITLARICTKDYQLRNTNIIIEKGTSVVISTLGLGMDPEYFPDPEKFDPERFTAEAKASRHPYIHLPFGEGPRNCIGLRFGIMQTKIGLVKILTNFRISVSPSTKMPLTIDERFFLLKSKETLHLKAESLI
ncbi:hypothetical protein ABEB36_012738 [Hypothenemus hampei]|uniref:Cytochrome P450 n=1 Tax=Hypothenemus hampei TaxID=57062 RepID=A0ABD1EC87_HYPHA